MRGTLYTRDMRGMRREGAQNPRITWVSEGVGPETVQGKACSQEQAKLWVGGRGRAGGGLQGAAKYRNIQRETQNGHGQGTSTPTRRCGELRTLTRHRRTSQVVPALRVLRVGAWFFAGVCRVEHFLKTFSVLGPFGNAVKP